VSGRAHPQLAEEIAYQLGLELMPTKVFDFANGEIYFHFTESVRGADVFVIQSHSDPINKNIMENLIMLDALKRTATRSVTAVIPHMGYARQDKKHNSREPITARLMVDLIATAGANRLMTVDLHSDQIQGFFNGPVDHLEARSILVHWVQRNVPDLKNAVIVSPDAGRTKGSEKWGVALGGVKLAFVHKIRDVQRPNRSFSDTVVGDVKDRVCIITDDLIDTAGTVVSAVALLEQAGAREIYVLATHGIFSGNAPERLQNCAAKAVVVTNTLPILKAKQFKKLEILSIAPAIAASIDAIFRDKSLGALYAEL
jgi:ribose-phosphate pyrophosphokinase